MRLPTGQRGKPWPSAIAKVLPMPLQSDKCWDKMPIVQTCIVYTCEFYEWFTDSGTWVAVHSYYPQAAKMQPQFLPYMHGVHIPCSICPNLCLYCRSSAKLLVPPSPIPITFLSRNAIKHYCVSVETLASPSHITNLTYYRSPNSKQLLWLSHQQAMAIVCMPNT